MCKQILKVISTTVKFILKYYNFLENLAIVNQFTKILVPIRQSFLPSNVFTIWYMEFTAWVTEPGGLFPPICYL